MGANRPRVRKPPARVMRARRHRVKREATRLRRLRGPLAYEGPTPAASIEVCLDDEQTHEA